MLVYVGRYTEVKRVPLLIRSYAEARKRFTTRAPLVLIGGHPGEWEGEHPLAVIRETGVEDVFLAGWRSHDDLPEAFAASDLIVLPSVREAFGLVLVEAMTCGLPAVAVNAYGPAEIVDAGETGWLVPPDDGAALADALVQAVNDRGRAPPARRARVRAKPRTVRLARHRREGRLDLRDGRRLGRKRGWPSLEPRQETGRGRTQVVHERLFVPLAGNERRPARQLVGRVQVPHATAGSPASATQPKRRLWLKSSTRSTSPRTQRRCSANQRVGCGRSGVAPESCGCAATTAAPAERASSIAATMPSSIDTNRRSPTATAWAAWSGSGSLYVSSTPGTSSRPWSESDRHRSRSISSR